MERVDYSSTFQDIAMQRKDSFDQLSAMLRMDSLPKLNDVHDGKDSCLCCPSQSYCQSSHQENCCFKKSLVPCQSSRRSPDTEGACSEQGSSSGHEEEAR